MANFYTDIPELKYHLNNPMMERICHCTNPILTVGLRST